MSIAAVIVRYRGGDEVSRCLQSLAEHGGEMLEHTVLVDSGSGDGGAEALRREWPQVEVEALEENRSFAFAANHGAAGTDAALLLLLNPDAEVLDGCLERLAEHLRLHPRAAGAVPLLQGTDGASQHRWQLRQLPTTLRLGLGIPGAPAFPGAPPSQPEPVPQPAAAAWLLRREVWESLAGLDPAFAPAWWEDVDFCARLHERADADGNGFQVVPSAVARHQGGSSVASLGDGGFLIAFNRNLIRYAERHHPRQAPLIRLVLRISLMTRAGLRPSRRGAYLAAARSISPRT